MEIGYNKNNNQNSPKSVYDQFIGQPGHYGVGATSATGVLKEINMKEGYISVQPSIIGSGDETRLEDGLPSVIQIIPGNPISARPLQKGDLERIVEEIKSKKE